MDKQEVTILCLLDLSAAFDFIDHDSFFTLLQNRYGLDHRAQDWFMSFLTGRWQQVTMNKVTSEKQSLTCGVPQGSCAGPLCFLAYLSPLYEITSAHDVFCESYADDTQVYRSFHPTAEHESMCKTPLESCIHGIRCWMTVNWLKLNDNKTEVL